MPAHGVESADLAQSIHFIQEDNAGSMLLGLIEEVPDAGRSHSHDHLDELGTAHAKKHYSGFARNGLCEQRLAGPPRRVLFDGGRSDDQDPAGPLWDR